MEDGLPMNSMIPEAGAHYHEETDDSELSESEKHEAHAAQGMDAPAKKRKIWRVMLSPSQALEIYNRRPPLKEVRTIFISRLLALLVLVSALLVLVSDVPFFSQPVAWKMRIRSWQHAECAH
eukprot:506821-Rhodomonas_salina.1